MRQGSNQKRMRGRGNNGRKNSNPRSNSFESSGPEIKVRGNAQQVVEKYLALARDASLADDRVAAENYFQHAEHYYRLMTANDAGPEQRGQSASTPAQSDNPPQENTQSSEKSAALPEASGEQSAKAPVDENGADAQKPPVDDPASSPQPEIGYGDGARPE